MSSLAPLPVDLADAAPAPTSWDDRRASIRRTLSELSWLNQVRLKSGPIVSLLDLSSGGAHIETTNYRLQPGSTTFVEVAAGPAKFIMPSRVLRAHVSKILPSATTYRAALAFKRPLDLPELTEAANQSESNLSLVHEHATLNAALQRLDESIPLRSDAGTAVGQSAVAAALAIMESPARHGANAAFSRELSRLFRIITAGLRHDTSPRAILAQMIEGVRRAVPQQTIRVVNQGSLVRVSSDAICFDGRAADSSCAARLVVEFPRGCRLEAWHFSFLKAAAHLATVVNEIERVRARRNREAAVDSGRNLPQGWQRLVVHYLDGRLLKGFNANFASEKREVDVWMVPNGPHASRVTVPLGGLKALFFVQEFDGYLEHRLTVEAWAEQARRITVTFLDGEVLEGRTPAYSPEAAGFFVTPLERTGNNLRVFVPSGAVRHVSFPVERYALTGSLS